MIYIYIHLGRDGDGRLYDRSHMVTTAMETLRFHEGEGGRLHLDLITG